MKRKKLSARKSKKMFKKTASRVKRVNLKKSNMRGGIRF
jgi:hypothetical protein